jgi:molybdopterin-guanine dinucleotide biosynthesis protein A
VSLLSGIVLAGGNHHRLGRPKAQLRLGPETLLERVLRVLRGGCEEIVIVRGPGQELAETGVRVVADEIANAGPLAGLAAGLACVSAERSFVAACDLPFLSAALIELLAAYAPDHDVIIPRAADGLHPLCGLYSRRCLAPIRQALARGERKMTSFHQEVRVCYLEEAALRAVDPQLRSLININTWQDYQLAKELYNASDTLHHR